MRVAEGVSNQWTGSPLECGTGMWDWTFNWKTGQHYIWSIQSLRSMVYTCIYCGGRHLI